MPEREREMPALATEVLDQERVVASYMDLRRERLWAHGGMCRDPQPLLGRGDDRSSRGLRYPPRPRAPWGGL